MKESINALKVFGLFVFYVLMQNIPALIIKGFSINNSISKSIILLFFEILVTIIFILIYFKDFKEGLNKFKNNEKKFLPEILKLWGYGLIIMIVSNTIINVITGGIANNEAVNREIASKFYIYAFPSMVIFAPICEETIFRLSLRKAVNNKYLFPIISGLLFGFIHVLGTTGLELLYIIPYASLGFVFAYMYQKQDTIISSITAHIIHNLICAILIVLA